MSSARAFFGFSQEEYDSGEYAKEMEGEMKETEIEKLAHKLYEVYCDAVGGLAFNGDKLPSAAEFFADESKRKQAMAWRAVALNAIGELGLLS